MFPELSDASPVSVVFEEKCPLFCGTLGELQLEIISGRGSGGQGAVFEARVAGYSGSNKELEDISKQQDAMQRRVAVKVLLRHSDLLPDRAVKWTPGTWCTAGQRQFGIEVQAARRCAEHDPSGHVLRVHAVGYVNVSVGADPTDIASRPALILEYAAGGSLGDLMAAQGGKLDTDPQQASASLASHKAWLAGKRMLRALRAASKAMVVHRDAKPDNMFLTVPGDVRSAKLGDLGYAMRMYEACDRGSTQVYTPGYEAPEVVENVHHGSELDVWLLGCSLLSMLTGQPPFYHSRCLPPAERAAWRHGGELVRPGSPYCDPQHPDYAQVGRYLTQAERDVLQQMLHVDPRRRPTHRKLYGTPYFMWGPTGSADYPLWELV
jgi:serine/threonine protein kinase